MEKKCYKFIYNNKVIFEGWFKQFARYDFVTDKLSEMQIFAMGIVIGLKAKGIKYPGVEVWELGEEKENLVLIQR